MSKILLISENQEENRSLEELLKSVGYDVIISERSEDALTKSTLLLPDIAIVDTNSVSINISELCRDLKLNSDNNDVQVILITSKNPDPDKIMIGADGYLTKPFNNNILIASINAHLRIKKLLDILYSNNSELAKSLYQLNVLYNTSSKLAGTLDQNRLVDIMLDGLEKSLNFDLCSVTLFNSSLPTVILKSKYNISKPLIEKILDDSVDYYKKYNHQEVDKQFINLLKDYNKNNSNIDEDLIDGDRILEILQVKNKPVAIVEVLKYEEFSGEDITCFQTLVKQVALPVESATLYNELKSTNMKLKKLEQLKSEFISVVSHELRTPLTSIKNSLDIILSKKAGDVTAIQNNFLAIAKRNVDRLSTIINDLLDLSKIEAGKMEYRYTNSDINTPIQHIIQTFKTVAEEKNITLMFQESSQPLPEVYIDIDKIEQVLANLLSNAIKFTYDHGEIVIETSLINGKEASLLPIYLDHDEAKSPNRFLESEQFIKIAIQDTGIGIDKENIKKVFDKFSQIENSLSRNVGGTGLGLTIVKQLIKAHNGEIGLISELGKGSTFFFVLPVLKETSSFKLDLVKDIQSAKHGHASLTLAIFAFINNQNDMMEVLDSKTLADTIYKMYRKEDVSRFIIDHGLIKIIFLNTSDEGFNIKAVERLNNYLCTIGNLNKNKLIYSYATYPHDALTANELEAFVIKDLKSKIEVQNV